MGAWLFTIFFFGMMCIFGWFMERITNSDSRISRFIDSIAERLGFDGEPLWKD